jgi:DNA repair protein RadA
LTSLLIEDVEWIPQETSKVLKDAGLISILDLALAPTDLLVKHGVDPEAAVNISEKAVNEVKYLQMGSSVVGKGEQRRKVFTGSKSLDQLLGGGVSSGRVTEVFGESGVGKTQLCFQLCVNLLATKDDEEGDVVFIDTVGTFRPERIAQMAADRMSEDDVFKHIFLVNARSSAEQIRAVQNSRKSAMLNIKMLIIDTLTDNFIYEFHGDNNISSRQISLAHHLHDLVEMALDKDIPIVVTNTVRARMLDIGEALIVETGGNTVAQGVHLRLKLERLKGKDKEVSVHLIDDTDITATPRVRFKIEKNGIMDWEEK